MPQREQALEVARTRQELAAARAQLTGTVAVVMTMGALHAGHAELIRQARSRADAVLVTVFVNPLQFGPSEDLATYPRTLDADLALCAAEGVQLVFAPAAEVMYPHGEPGVRVCAGRLGEVLEGASRPGHFDGVLTVVAKLLHLTRPHLAYFGRKDAQQLLLVRRMVRDLDLDVEVVAVPTVREPDGLALSSRNRYLTPEDRQVALALPQAMAAGASAAAAGADGVLAAVRTELARQPRCHVDYLVLVDPDTLADVDAAFHGEALLAGAARVGSTRLIDNVLVDVVPPEGSTR